MKKLAFFIFLLNFHFLFCQLPNYVPTNGLQGFWPYTGNANDISGNGNNGTVMGAIPTSDRFNMANRAYKFNGINNYIMTNYPGILGTNPRSVSFWARTSQSVTIMCGVAWGTSGTAARYEAGFNYGAPGPMLDGGNGVITYSAPISVYDNLWHHYVMQFGTSSVLNQVQIWQDGVLLTIPANVYNGTNTLNTISAFNVQFGRFDASPYHYFDGDLDDFGIWDRPLTFCEIQQLFTSNKYPALSVSGTFTVCQGKQVTLVATGATSYSWSNTSTSTSITVSPSTTTNYTVTGTQSGCSSTSVVTLMVSECTFLECIPDDASIDIFPNPAIENLHLNGLKGRADITLYNSLGIVMNTFTTTERELTIDLRDLSKGIYFIKADINLAIVVKRFLKE